jgi:hypothetical protein
MRRCAQYSAAAVFVGLTLVGQAAVAATTTIYNNIPAPLPGNVPSVGLEANSASEFGGQVEFGGSARHKPTLTVVMSSWACQNGTWSDQNCGTNPGATFSHPLTAKVYEVGDDNEPGELIGVVRHTFKMPYRPSANFAKCTGDDAGKWYQATSGTCFNGKAFTVTFGLGSLDLPEKAIISVTYNTTHFGYHPIGESPTCFGSSSGCPYDALNVGTTDSAPSAGSQPLPDDAYLNSSWGGAYCDNGAGGTGTFRLDAGCWTGFQPAFKVRAK